MVEDATGSNEVLESRRSRRKIGLTSSHEVKELHEGDFDSEDNTEVEPDVNEEDNIFADSDEDRALEKYRVPEL